MRFPWDSAVTDVHYTGGPHGSPWVICGSYSWSGYEGIDFGMSQKAFLAVAGGSISSSGYDAVYGNYVVVDHGGGWTTHYWHLQSVGSGIAAGVVVGQGRFLRCLREYRQRC